MGYRYIIDFSEVEVPAVEHPAHLFPGFTSKKFGAGDWQWKLQQTSVDGRTQRWCQTVKGIQLYASVLTTGIDENGSLFNNNIIICLLSLQTRL